MNAILKKLTLLPAIAALAALSWTSSDLTQQADMQQMHVAIGAGGVDGEQPGEGGEPVTAEPVDPVTPEGGYWCKPFCSDNSCKSSVCGFETFGNRLTGKCIKGVRQFSGICEEKQNGPYDSCDTKPANGFCVKYYKNACDTKQGSLPKCDSEVEGCGSASKCQ